MKKLLIFICLFFILSCSKENIGKNQYKGTSWTATDDISELIYGKTCTTTIEFLTENTCQEIEIRNVKGFGAGTFVTPGTYVIKNDSAFWTIDKLTIGGIIKGSVLSTNMGRVIGGKRVYTKDK